MPTTLSEAADAFYVAGNQMLAGDPSGFAALWSSADDISLLSPLGAMHFGRAAVMEEIQRESGMGFVGTLVADDRRLVETAVMGLLVCMERTRGMSQAGEAIEVDIRSTTVFRKEGNQWYVVHHHTDRF
jgi:ketosteroid isomerase-like protein